MDIKKAKDITRTFLKKNTKINPFLASDWKIIKNDKIYLVSEISDFQTEISLSEFLEKYSFNNEFNIQNNEIEGFYYYTSLGLISEEKYMEALDFIELYDTRIKKTDLVEGNIYLSDKNKRYVYIENITKTIITYDDKILLRKEFQTIKDILFDIEENKTVKLSSIKLIEDLNTEYTEEFTFEKEYSDFNQNQLLSISYRSNIRNINFYEKNEFESFFFENKIYYDEEELEEFMRNNNKLVLALATKEEIEAEEEYFNSMEYILDTLELDYSLRENIKEHILNMNLSRLKKEDIKERVENVFLSLLSKSLSYEDIYVVLFFLNNFEIDVFLPTLKEHTFSKWISPDEEIDIIKDKIKLT